MTRRIAVEVVCDLPHGTETAAERTVRFSLGRDTWEIDLCSQDAEKMGAGLAPFIRAARKVNHHRPARRHRDRQHAADVREWATAAGMEVSDRGRIPVSVEAAFQAAHGARSGSKPKATDKAAVTRSRRSKRTVERSEPPEVTFLAPESQEATEQAGKRARRSRRARGR
jgi:hypothetical protein